MVSVENLLKTKYYIGYSSLRYKMSVKDFKNVPMEELSMVEIASEILKENKQKEMKFDDLFSQVKSIVGDRGADQIATFYTDLNIDGSFISLGDNKWGLRSWYPIDSIDEALHEIDDTVDEEIVAKPVKKPTTNNFDDDDVIDYNDDDPEDDNLDAVVVEDDEESPEDEAAIVEDIDDDEDAEDVATDMNLTEVDEEDLDDLGDDDEEK